VANELVANVIRHGGGSGRLRLWRQTNSIYCQVDDQGLGVAEPEQAGTKPVPTHHRAGRGLWIVRRFTDECTITSEGHGTTVTVLLLSIRLAITSPSKQTRSCFDQPSRR
jgi:anti-sigma regulatory factor (Ser/Thr protein kinase)